jgi:hypothetical protein
MAKENGEIQYYASSDMRKEKKEYASLCRRRKIERKRTIACRINAVSDLTAEITKSDWKNLDVVKLSNDAVPRPFVPDIK